MPRDILKTDQPKPFSGICFLITRDRTQGRILSESLTRLGGRAQMIPTLRILPPASWKETDRVIARLSRFKGIVFTSPNAVRFFLDRVSGLKKLGGLKKTWLAAIGASTRRALHVYGLKRVWVPSCALSSDFGKELARRFELSGQDILLPRGDLASDELPRLLAKAGARIHLLTVYRNQPETQSREGLRRTLSEGKNRVLLFASASAARSFAILAGADMMGRIRKDGERLRIATIGPKTSQAVKEVGLWVDVEAREHSVPGLLRSLKQDLNVS